MKKKNYIIRKKKKKPYKQDKEDKKAVFGYTSVAPAYKNQRKKRDAYRNR